ncbi:MAG: class I tRNA ligase family protein [Coriobacteriales bacterium]|nr:class I tRNA ligase family protein [Coriobacteriales bacterium]
MSIDISGVERPSFPARAVITAGMPYGNKELHFGHISGVFVPADYYARFLRDRIGAQNVIFVSGTDCYGSPIMEGFRKKTENGYEGTIVDYVNANHVKQVEALNAYSISCNLFAGSALEPAAPFHAQLTLDIINRLYEQGVLSLQSTSQFYDPQAGQFLNGRQVQGHCPVQGCKSEKAYADECDLGHQFEPSELINPISQLTGCKPELRPVNNWYFDLPKYRDFIASEVERQNGDPRVRDVVTKTVSEWLLPPIIYVQDKFIEAYREVAATLPAHEFGEPSQPGASYTLTFKNWQDRDIARDMLSEAGVRFRTGKTLLPFRITGNIDWGVPAPVIEGVSDLTTWCWPESLWAPISFTQTAFALDAQSGAHEFSSDDWRDWWCSKDAAQFQFIGQDNIYFYCVAQPALWEALNWGLDQSIPSANYHVLFMGKKASSSSDVKPPMALDVLKYYTPEQVRAHWLSLGLADKPVSFSPKAWESEEKRNDPRVADPVLKESAMLTNVFNRLARSCFYGAQKAFDNILPQGAASQDVQDACTTALLQFEAAMHVLNFPTAMRIAEEFIRDANKRWSDASKQAQNQDDSAAYAVAVRDACTALHVAALLMHPAVPTGCEKIRSYFDIPSEVFFDWNYAFDGLDVLARAMGKEPGAHRMVELPPRTDFFEKHESQNA